ncbi:uncharacterized protein LOC130277738 [Hyla sarda]|uniref:uncharacterized protein LOC130277738 n=1 Tax=Hyla sarda TaxID=327740 RepID=UPI0024C37AE9|nr:uncharacterized protein LOC130277738 [Hyla sarda]
MGLQNFIAPWILYLVLLCESTSAGSENQVHMQGHNLDITTSSTVRNVRNHTAALVVHTHLQTSPHTNLVWTDFITDGQFGQFRFGIGLGPDLSSNKNEVTSSPMRIRSTEKLFIAVTAETNRSDVRLVITSCKLVSKKEKTKYYFIQDGCLDNKMVENILKEDNTMVFTLDLSGAAQLSGSTTVFISCEVKLCLNSNYSESCSSCLSEQPAEPVLETRTYHIAAKPIDVTKERRKKGKYLHCIVTIVYDVYLASSHAILLEIPKQQSPIVFNGILLRCAHGRISSGTEILFSMSTKRMNLFILSADSARNA